MYGHVDASKSTAFTAVLTLGHLLSSFYYVFQGHLSHVGRIPTAAYAAMVLLPGAMSLLRIGPDCLGLVPRTSRGFYVVAQQSYHAAAIDAVGRTLSR